ncbi:MAG TPA: hypothetical protein VF779_17340 [Pyrinomonadaceae bacterium]
MRSSRPLISKIISSALGLTLLCWLVGAGSLSCCAKNVAASSVKSEMMHEGISVSPSEMSGLHRAQPEHCRKRGREQRTTAFVSSCAAHSQVVEAMSCCSLQAQAFDGARKVRLLPERLATISDDIAPRVSLDSAGNQSFKSRLFLPDRGGTYLRACVFLI